MVFAFSPMYMLPALNAARRGMVEGRLLGGSLAMRFLVVKENERMWGRVVVL